MKKTLTAALIAATLISTGTANAVIAPAPNAAAVAVEGEKVAIVYTGRWFRFFGFRICAGQRFWIPGELQCV